jgi:hypothetical protein
MCDFGDASVSLGATWPRARKPHRCDACRETIKPGEKYRREGHVLDGGMWTSMHCHRCWRIVEALFVARPREVIDFDLNCGEVWEDPPEEVAALAFALPKDFE